MLRKSSDHIVEEVNSNSPYSYAPSSSNVSEAPRSRSGSIISGLGSRS